MRKTQLVKSLLVLSSLVAPVVFLSACDNVSYNTAIKEAAQRIYNVFAIDFVTSNNNQPYQLNNTPKPNHKFTLVHCIKFLKSNAKYQDNILVINKSQDHDPIGYYLPVTNNPKLQIEPLYIDFLFTFEKDYIDINSLSLNFNATVANIMYQTAQKQITDATFKAATLLDDYQYIKLNNNVKNITFSDRRFYNDDKEKPSNNVKGYTLNTKASKAFEYAYIKFQIDVLKVDNKSKIEFTNVLFTKAP